MKDWNLELKTLEQQKQNEEAAARLALVNDEVKELAELEAEFTSAGKVLDQDKQMLAEVTARNSPVIEQLTRRLNELKTAIKDIDVEMYVQNLTIKNKNLEVVEQQSLCNSLSANKSNGELEFARYMASQQTLIELKQDLETEKSKLTDLNNRFYELKTVPDIANIDRRIRELKTEGLNAQTRVESIERDRREMSSRTNFLRATIAKNAAKVSV
jgi:chromosome segregation ATPase